MQVKFLLHFVIASTPLFVYSRYHPVWYLHNVLLSALTGIAVVLAVVPVLTRTNFGPVHEYSFYESFEMLDL